MLVLVCCSERSNRPDMYQARPVSPKIWTPSAFAASYDFNCGNDPFVREYTFSGEWMVNFVHP
jgi:hypothetical protein